MNQPSVVNFNMGDIGNELGLETLILKCHMILLRLDSISGSNCMYLISIFIFMSNVHVYICMPVKE